MMYNTTDNTKINHKITMTKSEWWDNGPLPLWITAQNQVYLSLLYDVHMAFTFYGVKTNLKVLRG